MNTAVINSGFPQMIIGHFARGKEMVADRIGYDPVDFFGHGHVTGTDPRFNMNNRNA